MVFDKKEMIEHLKLEIQVIEKGGYSPSVRNPRQDPRIFRDSVSCLNLGLEQKQHPCTECFLMEFVPPEHRNSEEPCHRIPLNARGDTVLTLNADRDKLQAALLAWLRQTVAKLEEEVARGE